MYVNLWCFNPFCYPITLVEIAKKYLEFEKQAKKVIDDYLNDFTHVDSLG